MAVYFIRAGEDGPIKIGSADIVHARVKLLQTGNHLELVLLRTIDGDHTLERYLHRHFAAQRIRGEWFTFHPDMLTIEEADLNIPPLRLFVKPTGKADQSTPRIRVRT
jgi:hypothetical protein